MRFVLIRHGQSTNNLLWTETGDDLGRHADPALTPLGEKQAAALGDFAPRLPWRPTHVYASAMARAIQTAAPLADALDLPLRLHPDLFEVGGPYDHAPDTREKVPHPGSGLAALASLTPRLEAPSWLTEEGWWTGEVEVTREVVADRADRLIADLRATHADDDVVALVSHAWFANVVLARLLGITELTGFFELANTAICLVTDADDERWATFAVRVNWLPHLTPELVSDSALTY